MIDNQRTASYIAGQHAYTKDGNSLELCPYKNTRINSRTGYTEWADVQNRIDWFNGWVAMQLKDGGKK